MACIAAVKPPSTRTLRGLDWLNFFLADVQTGVGPFLAIYLASYGWNEQRVGIALTVGGIAGILLQTPAGALVDRVHAKRSLIGAGVVALAAGALLIALAPSFWPVMSAQVLIGGTASIFTPAICAVSLGIVGHRLFDARQGRNQSFNSAGNVVAAISMGLLGYYVSNRSIFFFVALCTLPTILALSCIRPQEIDYERARGAQPGSDEAPPAGMLALLQDRPLLIFLVCAVLFHFANAAMLPLLGEKLSLHHARQGSLIIGACILTAQVVMVPMAILVGGKADAWGRKPIFLAGFLVLPVRGLLYTLVQSPEAMVSIQVLDGIGAGIFGALFFIVVADLTNGSGRYNLALGLASASWGLGAALSNAVAGQIVNLAGFNAAFLFLAACAGLALLVFWTGVPETRGWEPAARRALGGAKGAPARIAHLTQTPPHSL